MAVAVDACLAGLIGSEVCTWILDILSSYWLIQSRSGSRHVLWHSNYCMEKSCSFEPCAVACNPLIGTNRQCNAHSTAFFGSGVTSHYSSRVHPGPDCFRSINAYSVIPMRAKVYDGYIESVLSVFSYAIYLHVQIDIHE